MSVQFTPYAALFFLSAAVTLGLSVFTGVWGRRRGFDPVTGSFFAMNLGATLFALGRGVRLTLTTPEGKAIGIAVFALGWATGTVAFPVFALSFAGHDRYLTPRSVGVLTLVAAVGAALTVTNPLHGWVWTGTITTDPATGYVLLDRDYSVLYGSFVVYSVAVYALSVGVLVWMAVRSTALYTGQALSVAVGALIPLILGVLSVLDLVPVLPPEIGHAPMVFSVTGLCFGYAIFRYRLLDVVPIGRRRVVEHMPNGYVVLDDADRVADLNPTARELATRNDGVIGAQVGEVLPAFAAVVDAHEHDSRYEELVSVEGDGGTRYVEVEVTSLRDRGDLLGRLLVLSDVTDRRSVRERYQRLIERSFDLIAVVDRDGVVQYVSPSAERLLGTDPDAMVGESFFERMHADDRATARAEHDRCLADATAVARYEYRLRDAAGEWRVFEAVGRNLLDTDPVGGVVVNSRDVSERKERERELERTNERLAEFASVVSHDLRNPLAAAKSQIELATATGEIDHATDALEEMDRMETIIEDVLALARQGDDIGETEPVDLDRICTDAWDRVAPEGELSTGDLPVVDGDPDRLLQLFENLFRNSMEHATAPASGDDAVADGAPTASGAGSLTVWVEATDDGFAVADDGPGIPPDEREAVFESGYTNAADGTGFGLAIVQRVAQAHGWSVSITGSRDGGARFEFDLAPD